MRAVLVVATVLVAVSSAGFAAEPPLPSSTEPTSADDAVRQGTRAAEAQRFSDAVSLYKRGLGATSGRAEFLLGGLVAEGTGTPKDYTEAARLFRLSAEQGFVGGMAALADLYQHGWGVARDLKEALQWRKAAANTAQPIGVLALARSYELGLDGETNRDEAIRWYRAAADLGSSDGRAALKRLGVKYLTPAEQLRAFYPADALRRKVPGHVLMKCDAEASGLLSNCTVLTEDPPGEGFGDAALKASQLFRVKPLIVDGKPVRGAAIQVPLSFTP